MVTQIGKISVIERDNNKFIGVLFEKNIQDIIDSKGLREKQIDIADKITDLIAEVMDIVEDMEEE